MAEYTPNLNLLKKDPVTDGNDTFNIKTMLNDNWDKIDANKKAQDDAINSIKDDIQNIDVPVKSVNDKTGDVKLTAADVGAETPSGAQAKANAALSSANSYTNQEVSSLATIVNNKVDKVAGKGLSTNDYTDAEKKKNQDNADNIAVVKDGLAAHEADNVQHGMIYGDDGNIYQARLGERFSRVDKIGKDYDSNMSLMFGYDDKFIYGTTNEVTQRLCKWSRGSLMEVLVENADYRAGVLDGDFLYLEIRDGGTIRKVDKNNLSVVTSTTSSLEKWTNGHIITDEDYIYAWDGGAYRVRKYQKSNLSLKLSGSQEDTNQLSFLYDDESHIYIGRYNVGVIKKYNKSDFRLVSQSQSYGSSIYTGCVDHKYAYIVVKDGLTHRLVKINKQDFSEVASVNLNSASSILGLVHDPYNEKLYLSISGLNNVLVFDAATLNLDGTVLDEYYTNIYHLHGVDESYLYFGFARISPPVLPSTLMCTNTNPTLKDLRRVK